MNPKGLQDYEARLIETAKKQTKRNEDRSFIEEQLIKALAAIVPFDIEQERLAKARSMLARSKRPGATPSNGQLLLPGFNTAYSYEPNRLVSDDSGNVIENHLAPPDFKSAAVGRAQENVERAVEQLRRLTGEMRLFQNWAIRQATLGRQVLDLTWGNCVAEEGIRQPDSGAAA